MELLGYIKIINIKDIDYDDQILIDLYNYNFHQIMNQMIFNIPIS